MTPPRASQDVQTLYEQHGRALLAYACSLLHVVEAAEDVVHQVFTRLLRGDVTIEGAPLPYLCRAVRNAALNVRRRERRLVDIDSHLSWFEAPPGLADTALTVQQALRGLPPEQREVVVLHVWGHMTFAEIGAALDISANTAASRYRYGLHRLRDVLKPVEAAE